MGEADRGGTSASGASREKGFVVEVPGLPAVRFLGWRSTHDGVRPAGLGGRTVNRTVIYAYGSIGIENGVTGCERDLRGCAILRPGDTFDRETGKKLALARLVEALIEVPKTEPGTRKREHANHAKVLRSRLFLEIWRRTHKGKMPEPPRRAYQISGWTCVKLPGMSDSETVRAGGLPIPQNQGKTANTRVIDEISKWPTPHEAAPSEKAPEVKKESRTCDVCGAVVMGRCEYCGSEAKA